MSTKETTNMSEDKRLKKLDELYYYGIDTENEKDPLGNFCGGCRFCEKEGSTLVVNPETLDYFCYRCGAFGSCDDYIISSEYNGYRDILPKNQPQ